MKPGKCGARTALRQPAMPRTPLLHYSFRQPPSDGINCSIVKGCNPPPASYLFSCTILFLCKQTQVCSCAKNWTGKAAYLLIPPLPRVNFDTISCPICSPHDCTYTCTRTKGRVNAGTALAFLLFQQQSRVKAILRLYKLLISAFTRINCSLGNKPPWKIKGKKSDWSNYKRCHERLTNILVLLKCQCIQKAE